MTKNGIGTLSIGALVLIALPAVSVAAPSAARQWSVENTYQIKSETDYVLYNRGIQLGYENRTFGVDLGRGAKGGFFAFVRQAPSGERDRRRVPIAGNDSVAIFNTKTLRYLMFYARGDNKAELEWSNTPVYEWQLQNQSAPSGRVHFALFNSRVKKYLVYKVQRYGINLGWFVEPPPQPLRLRFPIHPRVITNGWVPYDSTFGQGIKGKVISVQNADQKALEFVKPVQLTNNCSESILRVRVAPGGKLTADQMKLLYGSATPRTPISFFACIRMPTQSIYATFLYVTYMVDP